MKNQGHARPTFDKFVSIIEIKTIEFDQIQNVLFF